MVLKSVPCQSPRQNNRNSFQNSSVHICKWKTFVDD